MSQPYQTHYAQAHTPPPAPPRNGFGTSGFVLGLIGLIFSPIPIIGVVAWPLVILGLVFSAIGISRANKGAATNKGLAVAGVVLSGLGLAMCVLWVAFFAKIVNDVEEEANRPVTIQYEVSGDAANVVIDYTTYGEDVSSVQEIATVLPWQKEVTTSGIIKGGSLIATAGAEGGTVTCKVIVDGQEAKTNTSSGPFALATCADF